MTSRIGRPDTDADTRVRRILDEFPRRSFVVVAGAGSGKTTSLVKALDYASRMRGAEMRRNGQEIACITYTQVAVGEIWHDVGNLPLFHVSTIHSFLWDIIRPFPTDIRNWAKERLAEKIVEAEKKLESTRTKPETRAKAAADIVKYKETADSLNRVERFTYGTGGNYAKGILGHDDVLKSGISFLQRHPLARKLVRRRFPIVFLDESQDTQPQVVDALRSVDAEDAGEFVLGFFGDPMQQIYMTGSGKIAAEKDWEIIEKPENFRCPQAVLKVVNRIRSPADGMIQVGGRKEARDGHEVDVEGTARVFVLPADERRQGRLQGMMAWLAEADGDPSWAEAGQTNGARVLVLVHKRAASQLGFAHVFSALDDNGDATLKEGLRDGTAWVFKPFVDFFLPLQMAAKSGDDFGVMNLVRKHCPLLTPGLTRGEEIPALLQRLRTTVDSLVAMLELNNAANIRDLFSCAVQQEIVLLDDRFTEAMRLPLDMSPEDVTSETQTILAFLNSPASEIGNYINYIRDNTPFSTQHGVKGSEFEKVIVILDDQIDNYSLYSYNKFLGIAPLSENDEKNIREKRDSVIDRTRRLFYVCCSRATQDLVVAMFVERNKIDEAAEAVKLYFEPSDVITHNNFKQSKYAKRIIAPRTEIEL